MRYKKIEEIAKKYNLKIIEDSAHFLDLNRKEKDTITANYYSLDHSKVINTHLGGIVTTDNYELYKKLEKQKENIHELNLINKFKIILSFIFEYILFNKYFLWLGKFVQSVLKYFNVLFYFNDELILEKPNYYPCNLTSFQAKIGISQLNNIKNNLSHRQSIAKKLQDKIKWYSFDKEIFEQSTWLRYSFLVKDRDMFEKKFEKHFNLDVWYKSLFEGRTKNLHEIKYEKNSCPVAEHVSKHIVNLPTHLKIPQNIIDEIINKNWYWLKNNIDYNFRDRF